MSQRRIKKRLFTLGINNRLWWSDHKWTAETDCCLHQVFTRVSMCLLWPLVIRFHDGQGLWYVTYNASVLLLAVKVAKVNTLLQMWCFSQNEHCCFSASVKFQLISWMKTRLWGIKYSLYNLLYLIFCLLKQKHLVFIPLHLYEWALSLQQDW